MQLKEVQYILPEGQITYSNAVAVKGFESPTQRLYGLRPLEALLGRAAAGRIACGYQKRHLSSYSTVAASKNLQGVVSGRYNIGVNPDTFQHLNQIADCQQTAGIRCQDKDRIPYLDVGTSIGRYQLQGPKGKECE